MIYPLHRRNTKKLKNQTADFFRKHWYFKSNYFKKSHNNNIIFLRKNPKITILFWVLDFGFS